MKIILHQLIALSVCFLLPHQLAGQTSPQFNPTNDGQLSNSISDYPTIAYVGHTLYVAYWDNASVANYGVLGNLVVKRMNPAGTAWESVGENLYTNSTAMKVFIAYKGNTPYIVYPGDATYPGGIKKLNAAGDGWETVNMDATGLSGLQLTHPASVAFHDDTEYKVKVGADGYTLNLVRLNAQGTAWETVGPALAPEGRPYTINVVFDGTTPYISYNASLTEGLKANVKKLNAAGTAWETVGAQNFSTSQGGGISLTDNGLTGMFDNGRPYVYLIPKPSRITFGIPTLYKLNSAGNGWDYVGSPADFTGVQAQYMDVAFDNHTPYIAYCDPGTGRLTVKKLNTAATGWVTVGAANFTGPGSIFPGLAFVAGTPFVAYTDNAGYSNVKVKKLNAAATDWESISSTSPFIPKPVIIPGGSTTFATGGNVTLSIDVGNNYTYQWYRNGESITGANSASYNAIGSGIFTVKISNGTSAATSDPVLVNVIYKLPADNFKVSATSVTCKGQQDGIIGVTANKPLSYTASLTSNSIQKTFPFTTALSIPGLTAGTYQLCITVDGQPDYKQCFELVISEPKDLSVYTAVNKTLNTVDLTLNGSDNYHITLNGKTIDTNQGQITLRLASGSNTIVVTTDRLCQGTIRQFVNTSSNLTPYPNPFQNTLYVNLGDSNVKEADIEIYNIATGLLSKRMNFNHTSGVIKLDLSELNNGVYNFKLLLDGKLSDFKIIKK